jgi:hypothetical protein
VGLELGLGEKERFVGTAICMEGEKHCFPVTPLLTALALLLLDRVGEGEGEGEVRGEGKGPTPMVRGSMGSQVRLLLAAVEGAGFASLVSLCERS